MAAVLTRPLLYLSIQHDSRQLVAVNWALPAAVSGLLVCAMLWLAPTMNVFHSGGLVDKLLGFVQSLPGFYLAALAAVATFGKPGLDDVMPGTPPRAHILYNGQTVLVDLTRRRFLCLMFSYLTAISIGLTLALVGSLAAVDPLQAHVPVTAIPALRAVITFALLLFLVQMVVITLWGLYYLGERMHTPDK